MCIIPQTKLNMARRLRIWQDVYRATRKQSTPIFRQLSKRKYSLSNEYTGQALSLVEPSSIEGTDNCKLVSSVNSFLYLTRSNTHSQDQDYNVLLSSSSANTPIDMQFFLMVLAEKKKLLQNPSCRLI